MARKRTEVFRLTLSDESNSEHLWSLKFDRAAAIVAAITVAVVLSTMFFVLYAFTPIRTLIPGYPNASTKREAIENAIRIDSLENMISRWELYSENLRRVVEGEAPLDIDSLVRARMSKDETVVKAKDMARNDSLLQAEVTKESKFEIKNEAGKILPIEGMHFFTPLKGVVSKGYDMTDHPCIEITAPDNTSVNAVLEGTVISAGWSDEDGYTIRIQHPGDLISTYKHNQKITKKAGDKVNAGTAIGIVGKTAEGDEGSILTFELWHKGEAVDPTKYISF